GAPGAAAAAHPGRHGGRGGNARWRRRCCPDRADAYRGWRTGAALAAWLRQAQPAVLVRAPARALQETHNRLGLGARGPQDRPLGGYLRLDDLPGYDSMTSCGAVVRERSRQQ